MNNVKWSREDKKLIDFIWDNFKRDDFPVTGKPVWDKFVEEFTAGPLGPKSVTGEFQESLRYLANVIHSLQNRHLTEKKYD